MRRSYLLQSIAAITLLFGQVARAQGVGTLPQANLSQASGLLDSSNSIARKYVASLPVTQRAPTGSDDSTKGYAAGNLWNVPGLGMWALVDPTAGAAVWEPVATGVLPLDSVPGVALHGWGTRKLRAAYAGAPLAVTTPTVTAATDVPFDANGNVSLATLAADLGPAPPVQVAAPSSAQMWTANVTKLYDQAATGALDMTVPTGSVAPQIGPGFLSDGSPYIGFADGGMNWLTDYQQTQNIQHPRLQTSANYTSASDNLSVTQVLRNGGQGSSDTSIAFNITYPIAINLTDLNLPSGAVYAPASLTDGVEAGFNFQVPSTPSVLGVDLLAQNFTAYDDDNGSFTNSVSTTATVPISYPYITVPSTTGVAVGQIVTMAGVPAGTVVAAISSSTVVQISALSTSAETDVPVTFSAPALANGGSSLITMGGLDTINSGFSVAENAVIIGPSLTVAQSLALRESLTDTFHLTPQVRDQIIESGDSVGVGADGWMIKAPIDYASDITDRPYTVWNTCIAGTTVNGPAPSQIGLFNTLVKPLYRSYALNVMMNEGGINSIGTGVTPAQTVQDVLAWDALARGLGSNVRIVGRTLEAHSSMNPDSLRTTYNTLLRAQSARMDALDDEAGSPVLGSPNVMNDRTLTIYGGGHTSPYFQSMAGQTMGAAINAAARR